MNLVKRIKLLLTLKSELVPLIEGINSRYDDTNEWCKKKEWKVFDNIHKTLNVVEEQKTKEVENNVANDGWYSDRAIDIALKTFIVVNK